MKAHRKLSLTVCIGVRENLGSMVREYAPDRHVADL